MLSLTDIISKPVISLSQGKALGTAANVVFDKKLSKLTYLCVFDEEYGDKRFVPFGLVLYANKNSVIVRSAFYYEGDVEENSPLRAFLYSYDGQFSGIVEDVILSDELIPEYLKDGEGNIIHRDNIISFSQQSVITCYETDKLEALKKIKPYKKAVKKQRDLSVKAVSEKQTVTYKEYKHEQNIKEVEEKKNAVENEQLNGDENIQAEGYYGYESNGVFSLPPRNIVPSYNYLLGRKATCNIYDGVGTLIIQEDEFVTVEIIDICRRTGRLMALAKNSVSTLPKQNV